MITHFPTLPLFVPAFDSEEPPVGTVIKDASGDKWRRDRTNGKDRWRYRSNSRSTATLTWERLKKLHSPISYS